MDWWTLGFQAVNFLVLVWLLQYFLYRPVRDVMDRRKGEVDRAWAEAAAAKADADAARARYEAMHADAARAAMRIMDEAREAANRERNEITEQARAAAEGLVAAGRERIAREREAVEGQLRERIARLGMEVASRLLNHTVAGDSATAMLTNRALRMLEEMPPEDRARMAAEVGANSPLQVVSAQALSAPQTQNCRARIANVLGPEVPIDFTLDPELIAGVELRFPHSVLTCSWKASLTQALNALLNSDGDAARSA